MSNAADLAASVGINLRRFEYGNTKTLCPQCSHLRKKRRDPCLSVLIDQDGIKYNCHNCGWHGGKFYDGHQPKGHALFRGKGNRPGNSSQYRDLQRSAAKFWRGGA